MTVEEHLSKSPKLPPLDFIVVGSGQVVDKYWLRSEADGSINILAIISLEPEDSFRRRNPNFRGNYHPSTSVDETISTIAALTKEQDHPNVALVTPAQVRLRLAEGLLSGVDITRLFIEKPYASNPEDLSAFRELISKYPNRMHFSGKYANGRANILYPHLPEGRIPQEITGRLIEGTEYFEVVKKAITDTGRHQYLIDGPELDLGFHLMDIIGVGSQRFGGVETALIDSAYDLSQKRPEFEAGYGFGAKLEIGTSTGEVIPVDLQAGKADLHNERFIEFNYGDFIVGQEYIPGDSIDPVYTLKNSSRDTVTQHPSGYNYYTQELQSSVFCRQNRTQQMLSLSNTAVCLDIQAQRQGLAA